MIAWRMQEQAFGEVSYGNSGSEDIDL